MNKLKKMMALVIATAMIAAMAIGTVSSFAAGGSGSTVTISVTRDKSFDGEATSEGRDFTWYRVFTATYSGALAEFDGGHTSGVANVQDGSGTKGVSYIATPAVAAKLGYTFSSGTTTDNSASVGNKWFQLTYNPGTGNYFVSWKDGVATDAATMQAAAKWLVDNGAYEASGSDFSFANGKWSASGLTKGYYILASTTGNNLIAATTDIDVKEKNEYPPIDKKQSDEDDTTLSDDARDVAIGDKIDYSVTVHIPKTAKVGDKILVYDNKSEGLTYNNDLQVTANGATVGDSEYDGVGKVDGAVWQRLITVTAASIDKDVVFNFSMTVNSSALVDTGKKNESALKYGPGSGTTPFPYESLPDKVEYKTYFAGIKKIDGQTKKTLEGVKFDLKENGVVFNVIKSGSYYIPTTGSGSNEVVTDADGMIIIRGLDGDKTYTLTETATLEGYNLLAEDVTLTLHEDSFTSITYNPASGNAVEGTTYYQKNGDSYTAITVTAGTALPSGTYTASVSSGSTYNAATDDNWGEVENNKGSLLPSTGGIGTTIFYVIGAILVVGAGIVLVTRRRMNIQ